jgi:hypothetical protein
MRLVWAGRVLAVVAILGLTVVTTSADEGNFSARAKLSGFQETPVPKLSDGTGTFTATINGASLSYKLTFSGLSSPAIAAHIHFGQPGVTGGIVFGLCGFGTTPACPPNGGTVTGTVTAADIPGIPSQNLKAGDFAGAVRILESGTAYANVHSVNFPGGEIRGPVKTDRNSD